MVNDSSLAAHKKPRIWSLVAHKKPRLHGLICPKIYFLFFMFYKIFIFKGIGFYPSPLIQGVDDCKLPLHLRLQSSSLGYKHQ